MRGSAIEHGFTLLEALISMTIMVTLMAWAGPELSSYMATVRLRAAMSSVADSLRLTRLEAIQSNSRAVMCKSADKLQCSSSGDWRQGWIVFLDRNNSGVVDPGETIIFQEPALQNGIKLSGNAPIKSYVSYTALGKSEMRSGAFQAGTFTMCAQSTTPTVAYEIVINNMGRVRVEKTKVGGCDVPTDSPHPPAS